MGQIHLIVEQIFRQEAGKLLAALIGSVGDFTLAEDALQDALVVALERWPKEGSAAQSARLDTDHRPAQGD